jgi:hypothetical protein
MNYAIKCNSDVNLANILIDRAKKLGYKGSEYFKASWILDRYICLDHDGSILHGSSLSADYTLVSLDDFLFTDKCKFAKPKKPINVELNEEYTAVVTDVVTVGCQVFDHQKVTELLKAIDSWKSQK